MATEGANMSTLTDEELLDISDNTALKIINDFLKNKTVVPDFTSMPARYQLRVLKGFIDTALNMKPEDVVDHCPEVFQKDK